MKVYENRMVIDVGGVYYYTTETTLRKSPKLAEMIDEWRIMPDADEIFFVDRDGVVFYHILSFLRSGSLSGMPKMCQHSLMIEAAFFQLRNMESQLTTMPT